MNTLTTTDLLAQLHRRYATKKFDPSRKLPAEVWTALEDAIILSPSSFGLQPWKFIVPSVATREKLLPISYHQPQVRDASNMVIFAYKKNFSVADVDRFIARTAEVQGVSVESLKQHRDAMAGFVERTPPDKLDAWAQRQTYIAIGVFVTCAAVLGIDACPMEGINGAEYDKLLGLDKQGYGALGIATAGYRDPHDHAAQRPKVRFKKDDVMIHV